MDREYLEDIANYISKDDKIVKQFKDAIKNCNTDEEDEESMDFIISTLGNLKIKIDSEKTILDIGDERTKLVKLKKVYNDTLIFRVFDLYDEDIFMEDDFFYVYKDSLSIDGAFDNGEIADAISDKTGYLVDTVYYQITE